MEPKEKTLDSLVEMNALPSAQHTLEKRDLFPLLIHIISEL